MRERLKAAKIVSPQYNAVSRAGMKNGLTMPVEQVQEWIRTGKPYVVRLKMPHKTEIRFHDVIRGWVKVNTSVLDDKVLMKSDGLPTYHFANVVDDYLMKITHVIRGEEWLPSTPMHVLLYRYLGWTDYMPQFIHLPLLLAPNGKGKLSKRHAHEYGFPAFPIAWHAPDLTVSNGFREQGYLPEALLNFLALLGWNPGTNQEIFTKEELIAAFSLERLGKSAAVFDIAKANWFNQQHIKKLTKTVWASYFIAEAAKDHIQCSEKEAMAICTLVKDSITFPQDFWAEGSYFLCDPIGYNSDFLQKKWNPHSKSVMLCFTNSLLALTEWNQHNLKQLLQEAVYTHHSTMGSIMPLLRIVLTGRTTGPDLMEIIVLLGKDTTHKRLTTFLEKVKT
ncbi:glutamate--tRNA ligase [Candidatus Cardinium hertigii]|uniref:glutamate--tRNA ligase n=1 Tax=Candidatus Cardinium hertigii TaxID=247481 RepID=UPI00294FFDA4|nr:glutamate--tRNA ligase [Candidatus Cardinium hertigii]